jgi:hypothetical protein
MRLGGFDFGQKGFEAVQGSSANRASQRQAEQQGKDAILGFQFSLKRENLRRKKIRGEWIRKSNGRGPSAMVNYSLITPDTLCVARARITQGMAVRFAERRNVATHKRKSRLFRVGFFVTTIDLTL